jgi:malate synthase
LSKLALSGSIEILGPVPPSFEGILTPDAMDFVSTLERKFSSTREDLLKKRVQRQREFDSGVLPDFLPETERIRNASWKIAPIPSDLRDRRVEITGPAGDTKMVINALNSGANMYMADFEDSQSPTWVATIQGQINLRDAIRGTIWYVSPEGKKYKLNEKVATLLVRPRGWHLLEKHVRIDGKPISASLFDFGLFFYHNAKALLEKGTGPYFYLPKLESHLEGRLWNDVFLSAQEEMGIPRGTIKATVLIETILAAFEMDEILYELREHSSGLNCGRWDYIFSFIKKFRNNPEFVLPDRSVVTMDKGFLGAYVKLLIKTCHKRGAHAMGGMAAQIPIKNNEEANRKALERVWEDKEREVREGHDGTWVAHPGLVQLAKEVFDSKMPQPNQIHNLREDVNVVAKDLLSAPKGEITETGLRTNISVGIQYLEGWLRGTGSVALYNLMEDAATSEICRAQVWQWVHHNASLSDERKITLSLFKEVLNEEMNKIRYEVGEERYSSGQYELAAKLFEEMIDSSEFPDFLTLPAYEKLLMMEEDGNYEKKKGVL